MKLASIAIAALLLAGAAGNAHAITLGKTVAPGVESQLTLVHGCHRSCEWGPALGWHRHGAACQPIGCVPRAAHPNRCWIDWRGVRHCRW